MLPCIKEMLKTLKNKSEKTSIGLNKNINAQQAILNAYITNNSSLYKIYSANVSLLHRNIIRAI